MKLFYSLSYDVIPKLQESKAFLLNLLRLLLCELFMPCHFVSRNRPFYFWFGKKFFQARLMNVCCCHRPLSPDKIVGNALMKLGEVGYNVVYENCEHFASWCRYGSSWSEQADRLVFWIKSLTGIASSLAFLFGVARVFRLREKNKNN